MMKTKHIFMFLTLFILVTSITCAFAVDENSTTVGTTNIEQSEILDESNVATITIDEITEANIDNNIAITGKVTDETGVALSNSDVNISLTSRAYGESEYQPISSEIVKTNNNGIYSYSYMPTIGGQLNITANNDEINQFANTSIFVAPKSTVVTMNTTDNVNIGENLTITGRLTDIDGNALKYTSVGVLVRGTPYGDYNYSQFSKEYTRTDEEGYYSYDYSTILGGRFDVCVYYPGYHIYRFNRTDKSINVIPKATKVYLNSISNVTGGETVTVSGTLTDGDNNPLRSTSVGMLFNGYNKTYVRTDRYGAYSYNYTPKSLGYNNVIVYYPGYHNYSFTQNITEFNVEGKNTIIKLNSISNISYGEDREISGTLTDKDNNPLKYTSVNLDFNDNYTSVRTDDTGFFTYTIIKPYAGNYTVNAWFTGTNIYYSAENSTVFNVLGKETILSLNPISNTSYGENVNINGTLTDKDMNPISSANITLTLDDNEVNVITNDNGMFTYAYTAKKLGTNSIYAYSASYKEYYPSEASCKFTVTIDYSNMTINTTGVPNNVLRFSTQWYYINNQIDLDIYSFEPNGNKIYYANSESNTSGRYIIDDYTWSEEPVATEHIIYTNKNRMIPGTYTFKVQDYSYEPADGFIAEIEFDNKVYFYQYNKRINSKDMVEVAKVTYSNGAFSISNTLPATVKT